jgi:hypothetical protein
MYSKCFKWITYLVMHPAAFVESRGMLWEWWTTRSTVLITVNKVNYIIFAIRYPVFATHTLKGPEFLPSV